MSVAGIIAEYNPFHAGHEYHVRQTRLLGADMIVAVMSGNFTQRCEPAICEKHARAEMAVRGGVDVVLELPVRFALGSAERFAFGGVSILDSLGVVDFISFGSECGNVEKLKAAAKKIDSLTSEDYKNALRSGESFAAARASLIGNFPSEPNDVLGTEYIRALNKLGSKIVPVTVKRTDDYHESATELRKKIFENDLSSLPEATAEILKSEIEKGYAPCGIERLERVLLGFLRNCDETAFENVYGVNPEEGMDKRFLKEASAKSLEELYFAVKTKRFALSAVKRALLSAYLRLPKETGRPPYAHVLAFSERGRELLKKISKNITVVHNLAKVESEFFDYADEERRATDLFGLSSPEIVEGYGEYTRKYEKYR